MVNVTDAFFLLREFQLNEVRLAQIATNDNASISLSIGVLAMGLSTRTSVVARALDWMVPTRSDGPLRPLNTRSEFARLATI